MAERLIAGDPLADANSKMAERGTARAVPTAEYGESIRCKVAMDFDRSRATFTCDGLTSR